MPIPIYCHTKANLNAYAFESIETKFYRFLIIFTIFRTESSFAARKIPQRIHTVYKTFFFNKWINCIDTAMSSWRWIVEFQPFNVTARKWGFDNWQKEKEIERGREKTFQRQNKHSNWFEAVLYASQSHSFKMFKGKNDFILSVNSEFIELFPFYFIIFIYVNKFCSLFKIF